MIVGELMVGDLVLHDGKVIRVDAVHKRKIGYHKTKDKLTWLFYGQFQPIPLTPEILEKNGFNEPPLEMQKRVRFVVLCEEYQIRYSFNSYWFSIYKNIAVHAIGYPTFICAFQERIKYVHELQHALRLCKVDKEIVL